MPLTSKGEKILAAMKRQHGAKKGKEVFYASRNIGTITGIHRKRKIRRKKKESRKIRRKKH